MAFIQSLLAFIIKIFSWKHGASMLFSFCTSVVMAISFDKLNSIFFKGADLKNVWMPIFIESIMILLFLGMIFVDFLLGHRVAIKIRKEEFLWERGIDTMAKVIAMVLITSVIMFLAIAAESAKMGIVWYALVVSLCCVWVLGIGFEFGSIGRHLETLTGSKPSIFKFFDKVLLKIQDRAIKKVENYSFNINENEDDKDTNSNPSS